MYDVICNTMLEAPHEAEVPKSEPSRHPAQEVWNEAEIPKSEPEPSVQQAQEASTSQSTSQGPNTENQVLLNSLLNPKVAEILKKCPYNKLPGNSFVTIQSTHDLGLP